MVGDSLVVGQEYGTVYSSISADASKCPLLLLCFCSSVGDGDFLLLTYGNLSTQVLHIEWGHLVSFILPSIHSQSHPLKDDIMQGSVGDTDTKRKYLPSGSLQCMEQRMHVWGELECRVVGLGVIAVSNKTQQVAGRRKIVGHGCWTW